MLSANRQLTLQRWLGLLPKSTVYAVALKGRLRASTNTNQSRYLITGKVLEKIAWVYNWYAKMTKIIPFFVVFYVI